MLALLGFLGLCLLAGVVNGLMTARSVDLWYVARAHPPGTPPVWVFAAAWGVLYLLSGLSAWLVWRQVHLWSALRPLRLWGWQLLLSAVWPAAFFGLQNPALGLLVMLPLLVLVGLTIRAFLRASRTAAILMLPYGAWVCYATWLNAGIWWLA